MPYSEQDLKDFLSFADTLADAAGAVSLAHFRRQNDVENKDAAGFDPVTVADKGAEAAMRALIEQTYPSHGILGEEYGEVPSASGLKWVLDPIDGTRAFITGSPLWGTLIALSDENGPIIGVLDQPFMQERFVGVHTGQTKWATYQQKGGEKKELLTRACAGLGVAKLSTTTPDMFGTQAELAAFDALAGAVQLARYGGDCYQYGMLAYGFLDLVVEAQLKPFDIQALIPIVEGAGGIVTTWEGTPAQEGGRVVAAGDARTHADALKLLQTQMSGGS